MGCNVNLKSFTPLLGNSNWESLEISVSNPSYNLWCKPIYSRLVGMISITLETCACGRDIWINLDAHKLVQKHRYKN